MKTKTCEDPVSIEIAFIDTLRNTDRTVDADIVSKLGGTNSATKKIILEILSNEKREMVVYTPDEALALMIDLRLTKDRYHEMHMGAKAHEANIYPSYHKILEAKKRCYPSSITVSDVGAKISLQCLLNHTASRLLKISDLSIHSNQAVVKMKLIVKCGMDGSSGQTMVPLQFESLNGMSWSNQRPSSTKNCRPVSFEFIKESEENTVKQYKKIRSEVDSLVPFKVSQNNQTFIIEYEVHLTMVDGKTINYITSNSAQQSCNICGATPSDMNNLNNIKRKPCRTENYIFGLSTLHCWIRFLECILHIGYRLDFELWAARGEKNQLKMAAAKDKIQKAFKAKGLALDEARPTGGNSNNGNTARRFFDDVEFAAKTTRVDEDLIRRFKIILTTLCCGRSVDPIKFRKYAFETAELYCKLYPWYYMPVSVHKVLIHGADVINALKLPIGVYSEEAQEARNKDFKWIREHNTRKMSRAATNEDLIHGLLVSSDPVISNLRKEKPKIHKELDPEVMDLLTQN